jgi:hypothetical protein
MACIPQNLVHLTLSFMNLNNVPNIQWGLSVLLRVHQTARPSISITLSRQNSHLINDNIIMHYIGYTHLLEHFKTPLVSSDIFYGRLLGHHFVTFQNAKCSEYDVSVWLRHKSIIYHIWLNIYYLDLKGNRVSTSELSGGSYTLFKPAAAQK